MRIWIYGGSLEQIQSMTDNITVPCDAVVGSSVCAEADSGFPQSGLIPAVFAAIRGEIDLLLVPTFGLLGNGAEAEQLTELFQSYGASIKSVSSNGINSS